MALTLEGIQEKQATVGIVGLGYVGYPLALVFSEAGFPVIGFDIDKDKVTRFNKGDSYIKHINHGRLAKAIATGRISASNDFSRIAECDAVIMCVPTPLDEHLEPDMRYIEETTRSISKHIRPHTLVSLESTTFPGTTNEVVKPLIESISPLRLGTDLYLAYSPEREDPGNKDFNTKSIPKLVGGSDQKSLELSYALYAQAIDQVIPLSSPEIAEAAKLFENIFRSVNIALVNEMKVILEKMGIDVWEVIQAAGTKPFGFMSFWPGPGLGGHCIPIDPFYLTWKAKEFGISTKFIELAGQINRSMPQYVVSRVQDCLNDHSKPVKGSRILILGIAYKPDVDDMRESPSLELIRILQNKGAVVDYHDPCIPEVGKTRNYPFLEGKKSSDLSADYDCFVLSTVHSTYSAEKILSHQVPVIDARNFLPKSKQVYPA